MHCGSKSAMMCIVIDTQIDRKPAQGAGLANLKYAFYANGVALAIAVGG